MVQFPHLNENSRTYPHTANGDVYKTLPTLDYMRYDSVKQVHLSNVPWSDGYDNVIDWTAYDRDTWFDSAAGLSVTIDCGVTYPVGDSIKVPMSYAVSERYNYLWFDLPVLQDGSYPLDYQPPMPHRYFYFILAREYIAPNTTLLQVRLDVWTTFLQDVRIANAQLARGHYAIAQSADVPDYLSDPMHNTAHLLHDDVTYGLADGTVCKYDEAFPLGAGEKYIVIACAMGKDDFIAQFDNLPEPNANPWAFSPLDYSGSKMQQPVFGSVDNIVPGSVYNYAIESRYAGEFLYQVAYWLPQIIQAVVCVFECPIEYLTIKDTFTVNDYTLHDIAGVYDVTIDTISLDRSMWAYDTRYADYTKLYTSPYSVIELQMGDRVDTVEIEKCGDLHIKLFTALAYPALYARACVAGVGAGSSVWGVKSLDWSDAYASAPAGDWLRYSLQWDIPCFAVYETAREQANYSQFHATNAAQVSAANALASANASADTSASNTTISANATKASADASADTNVTNTGLSASQSIANASATNTANSANSTANQYTSTTVQTLSNDITSAGAVADWAFERALQDINAETQAATNVSSGISSVTSAAAGGLLSGGYLGAIAGAGMAAIGVAGNMLTSGILLNAASTKVEASVTNSQAHMRAQNDISANIVTYNNLLSQNVTDTNNDLNTAVTAGNAATSNAIAANNAATAKANATRAQTAAVTTANASAATAKANASRAYNSSQTSEQAKYLSADNAPNIAIGSYSGDIKGDALNQRAIHLRVRTACTDAIRMCGDAFARYGYADSCYIEDVRLSQMRRFTYWLMDDVTVYAQACADVYARSIRDILLQGVTVWATPDDLMRGGIYDN